MKKFGLWFAVVLLALMVGGITFVMVYLGNSRPVDKSNAPEPASLTFVTKRLPGNGEKAPTTEINQGGHADFWFRNDSGQDVPLGLIGKGCTCTTVELALAPESWKPRLLDEQVAFFLQRAALQPPFALGSLDNLAAMYPLDDASTPLPENEVKTMPVTKEEAIVVPAGAYGWVRMTWHRRDAGPLLTNAELWMNHRGGPGSANARLDVGVLIAAPLEVETEKKLGPYTLRELEKDQQSWLLCWSLTRPSFHIKVETPHGAVKPESDPIEIGQPIPLTEADLRFIESTDKRMHVMQVKSGYRIPVTVRAKAKDGTPLEWGHFRRYVHLSSEDEGIDPIQVQLNGEVHGEVTVGSGKEGGSVNFGPFLASQGARSEILLQTDSPELDLVLDKSHCPKYIQVHFPEKPEETLGGHRIWLVEVRVLPGAADGEFPRRDNPIYHDSAIYVKTKEKQPRTIRIPVRGAANADK